MSRSSTRDTPAELAISKTREPRGVRTSTAAIAANAQIYKATAFLASILLHVFTSAVGGCCESADAMAIIGQSTGIECTNEERLFFTSTNDVEDHRLRIADELCKVAFAQFAEVFQSAPLGSTEGW